MSKRIWMSGLVLLVLVATTVVPLEWRLRYRHAALARRVAAVEAELSALASEVAEVRKFQNSLAELERRIVIITNLQETRCSPLFISSILESALGDAGRVRGIRLQGSRFGARLSSVSDLSTLVAAAEVLVRTGQIDRVEIREFQARGSGGVAAWLVGVCDSDGEPERAIGEPL